MKHKHHGGPGPIPPGNQPQTGTTQPTQEQSVDSSADTGDAGFGEKDPKRRLGDYTTEGEHSFVQPGGRNDSHGRPSSGAGK